MVLLLGRVLPSTPGPGQGSIRKELERADTVELVKEGAPKRQECPQELDGWGDKEPCEDCWRNIVHKERSTNIFSINSTLLPKVINIRTKLCWLKRFKSRKNSSNKRKNCLSSKMQGENAIKKRERKNWRERRISFNRFKPNSDHEWFNIEIWF